MNNFKDNLLKVASFNPYPFEEKSAWLGHLPFSAWLILTFKPKIFVELGTHWGHSYFSFCQAMREESILGKCYAVDTWQGEEHAGLYTEEVFNKVSAHNEAHYAHFSNLLRMSFDEAVGKFSNGSINLLHIDGLHTYEAVKHDFETWLPKLAPGAIVLFHDTQVRDRGFGVWKLWEELKLVYPRNMEFVHSYGLGVLQIDGGSDDKNSSWLDMQSHEKSKVKEYFSALGARQIERFELNQLKHFAATFNQAVAERDMEVARLNQALTDRDMQTVAYHNAAVEREQIILQLHSSYSWKMTKPFRVFFRAIRRVKRIVSGNLSIKLSSFVTLFMLVKPHLYAVFKDPSLIRTKLYFLNLAWKESGLRGVVSKLNEAKNRVSTLTRFTGALEVHALMQYIAGSTCQTNVAVQETPKVAIVIPVYRGVVETAKCIDSVLESKNFTSYELLIINDASPEPGIDKLLHSLDAKYPHVHIMRNAENMGFVRTVNLGMELYKDCDIVLLNSDTIVANDWLDRLVVQAYASQRVGTVTPFSNNATICNYPDLDGWDSLPNGETVSLLDIAFSTANTGKAIEIPTAVGFCMYIKRNCLKEVGLFDEEAFGKGYGEENDFCLRAVNKGWKHILATDIFVFHKGEVSFSSSAISKKAIALKVIQKRYPSYEKTISSHIALHSAQPYRLAATAARYRLSEKSVVLFITHTLGGGTERHVQELAYAVNLNNTRVLFLRPTNNENGCDIVLEAYCEYDRLKLNLSSQNLALLAEVLRAFGIDKVHIHHTIGFNFSVEDLLTSVSVPYDVTVHDFYPICPRVNLRTPKKGYCGSPTVDDCNACIDMNPKLEGDVEIVWWRAKFASLLNGADNVYCPSNDTASRIVEHFPAAPIRVVPHENITPPLTRRALTSRKIRRFAILGVLAEHKGLSLIADALAIVKKENLPIEFALIGYSARAFPSNKFFTQTGPYEDAELPALIEEIDPDAILFPAQWPETYSYTLSIAILSGRPVVVSNIGALPERVKDIPNSFIFPYQFSGLELVDYLLSLQLIPDETKAEIEKVVIHA
jgi:GT2 family glycosyltransferase/glycosyltransferase involved in cell wall biosynthesis